MASKRKSDTNTGVTPENKGRKIDDGEDEDTEQTKKTYAEVTVDSIAISLAKKVGLHEGSICSGVSSASMSNPFRGTTRGLERDQIVVDVFTIDGILFKDQLTDKEQNLVAFRLGVKNTNLNGIAPGFTNGHPVYTYRLHEKMNVKEINFEEIKIKRTQVDMNGAKIKSEIICQARGAPIQSKQKPTQEKPDYRWVRIEDSKFNMDEEQIKKWLTDYEDDSDLSESEKEYLRGVSNVGTGTMKVLMKFARDKEMAQYLPMFGNKIRLYYMGITKICTNCYCTGHIRRTCRNEKRQWISYVMDYMDQNPEIPNEFYGRWSKVVANELKQFGYSGPKPKTSKNQVDEIMPIVEEEEQLINSSQTQSQEQRDGNDNDEINIVQERKTEENVDSESEVDYETESDTTSKVETQMSDNNDSELKRRVGQNRFINRLFNVTKHMKFTDFNMSKSSFKIKFKSVFL